MKIRFTALCALALCLLGAGMRAEPIVVRLNDGAPIPYLEGYEGGIAGEWIRGVTGAIDVPPLTCDGTIYDGQGNPTGISGYAGYEITLQNIALTDDYFVAFYKLVRDIPFDFPYGTSPYFVDKIVVPVIPRLRADETPPHYELSAMMREARLLDERTALCMFVMPLLRPLPASEPFRLDVVSFREQPTVRIDAQSAVSPDVRYEIGQAATFRQTHTQGAGEQFYACTLESLTFSPLGNRLVIGQTDKGEGTPLLRQLILRDRTGQDLPCVARTVWQSSLASEEHPFAQRTALYFSGGEPGGAVSIMPSGTTEPDDWARFETAIDIGDLPVDLDVQGRQMRVERFDLWASGFEVRYTADAGIRVPSSGFTAADEARRELALYPVSYGYADARTGEQVCGAYWQDEYKGRPVRRMQAEDLDQIRSLLLRVDVLTREAPPIEAQAVRVELVREE